MNASLALLLATSISSFSTPAPIPQDRRAQDRADALLQRLERLTRELEELRGSGGSSGTSGVDRLAWYEEHRAMAERTSYDELAWKFLGPTNLSGRVTDVAAPTPRGRSYVLYVATASGGLWKSDNEGTTFEPIFQHAASTSIGDVAIAPSDPNVVWIGTGEANIFRSSNAGSGVYRSLDAGATWEHVGLPATHTIARIVIHPGDPEVVYVAASGHEWTDNPERGVYRTRDGGASWELVFHLDERTGVIDLAMDPSDPERLFACTWERRRKRWNDPRNEPTTSGSAVWRTEDGGVNWLEIVAGLPRRAHRGRIGIDIACSRPEVLYCFVDNYEKVDPPEGDDTDSYGRRRRTAIRGAEVYRSDDRGDHWRKTSASDEYMQGLSATYGWVFGQIRVDPTDEDTIYVMGLGLNVSHDGGATFEELEGMHGDHHALWIDPENPLYLVNGNDGGVDISYDGGENWKGFDHNLPAVQFYNVGYDMEEPFHVYGSIQDHGSFRGVVDLSRGRDRIRGVEFEDAPGGEASYHAIDPTDPSTVYSAGFYGRIQRTDLETDEAEDLLPERAEEEEPWRGQWLAPFLISPHNPRIIYHGMNVVMRSLDGGSKLEAISPDLSHAEQDREGDIPYQTITSIAESPLSFGWIYAGTDDGRLHLTRDGGRKWKEIGKDLAHDRWISRVEASRFQLETVYVAQNGKRWDDFAPYLWKSIDAGKTWRSIARGIPSGPINVVREDPTDPRTLYVGTDLGVYVSRDRGRSWDVLGAGLPTTYVHDLVVHPRDDVMVVATHGRGMWLLDLTPLRPQEETTEAPADEAVADESDADESAEGE